MSEQTRHRALSDGSRLALLRLLEASGPRDAHTLAAQTGLHVNTVRWHLGVLVDAGLVEERAREGGARGRPRTRYLLAPRALDDQPGGFRLLSELLIELVRRRPPRNLASALERIGRERGAQLVRPELQGKTVAASAAVSEIVRLLRQFGFRPRQRRGEAIRIDMRPCPFGELATENPDIVCHLHLGLLQGALEAMDADLEATSLEPLAEPTLCIAHLRRRTAVTR